MQELNKMCAAWDGTQEQFAQIIAYALTKIDVKDMAAYMNIPQPTIRRWAAGATAPMPNMRKFVVKLLQAKAIS